MMPALTTILLLATLPYFESSVHGIGSRLADADPTNSLPRYVDYANGAARDHFRPNPKFWLKGVDFSCVSPWNSQAGRLRAGTAISKRHVIFAKHFPISRGTRIVFVDGEGNVCPCYIEKTKAIDHSDFMVGSLNAELTPNIRPAKILPPDYEKYIGDGKGLPTVTFDQYERALLAELRPISTNDLIQSMGSTESSTMNWCPFSRRMIVGDSGSPAFLLIGNEPIFAYTLYFGGYGTGPAIHRFRREVQAAMDELCPGYKLETFDFEKVRCGDGK